MKNERPDELIDRVAADLVDGPVDRMLATRLRARLQPAQRRGSTPFPLATGAAAAIVIAVAAVAIATVVVSNRRTSTPIEMTSAPLAPLAPLAPVSEPSKPEGRPTLVVDALEITPLDEVAFDVDALEVDALAISALEDEKEPR
jgi:hypothetical protein